MLGDWKQALATGCGQTLPGRGKPPARVEEPRRLRAEVKRLAMGRDVLRRAAAFFARESS